MCVTEAELTQPTFYFCTQLGNIVSDQRISKHPRNSQRMINRITKRPPKSPERFESMWQGVNSLSCFFGGPPARRVKSKKGGPRKGGVCAETRRGAGQRPSFSRITQQMKDRHLVFWGGLSPLRLLGAWGPRNPKGIRPPAL